MVREQPDIAAIRTHNKNAVRRFRPAVRSEEDLTPVGRPDRLVIVPGVGSELLEANLPDRENIGTRLEGWRGVERDVVVFLPRSGRVTAGAEREEELQDEQASREA
jgi:hypothetical protein